MHENLLNIVFCVVIERHGGAALSFTHQACPECLRCQIKTKFRFVSHPFSLFATIFFSIKLTLRSVHCHTVSSSSQNVPKFRVPFVVHSPCVPCVTGAPALIGVSLRFAPLWTFRCRHCRSIMFAGTLGTPRHSVSKLRYRNPAPLLSFTRHSCPA